MIPFASQRGNGRDLATHLMNEHDNEYMELADLRGAIADDLHGAFAEWGAQASAMTKCKNFLYSLSINPDPKHGLMARELYDDYIARVEDALGLVEQPRAIVYHIKDDRHGEGREHCHVVWSRIDVQEMKAIHMSFDHDKLMTVTRQFARDHDIELSPGYHKLEDRRRQEYRQLSLYEKAQQNGTGLTREERVNLITGLWQQRDTPGSFVQALGFHGYILATGKRPHVLVDIYGHTNSLPKLIDDRSVKTEIIRDFLGQGYSDDNLPTVEEAKALAAQHAQALKDYHKSQVQADKIDQLKVAHANRRERQDQEFSELKDQQHLDHGGLEMSQKQGRSEQRRAFLKQSRIIRETREAAKPIGLSAFLAKVSGMELVRTKIHKYQDSKRHQGFQEEKQQLQEQQAVEQQEIQRAQEMLSLDMERKRHAMDATEKREMQSLKLSFEKQRHIQARAGHEHMPSLTLDLTPPGRRAVLSKAKNRFTSELGREHIKPKSFQAPDPTTGRGNLQNDFTQASSSAGILDGGSYAPATTPEEPSAPEFKPRDSENDSGRERG